MIRKLSRVVANVLQNISQNPASLVPDLRPQFLRLSAGMPTKKLG